MTHMACNCWPVDSLTFIGAAEAVGQLLVPDPVLRLLSARVRLLAVTVSEPGVDAQRDVGRVLCGIHLCIRPLHSVVLTGAGSLAVILQPAFFPFGLAVEYLLLQCLFMPLLVACAV